MSDLIERVARIIASVQCDSSTCDCWQDCTADARAAIAAVLQGQIASLGKWDEGALAWLRDYARENGIDLNGK